MFSVNIALNDEFDGGGTFFDGLIDNDFGEPVVQYPIAPGHAVAHRSTQRHGGAPTSKGIREILVFFLTARRVGGSCSNVERSFYLKEMAEYEENSFKLQCLQLATQQDPLDAEAHFWSAFYLLNGDPSYEDVELGIDYLESAARLCPSDARTLVLLGSAYSTRWAMAREAGRLNLHCEEEMEKTVAVLTRALHLEKRCTAVGCNEDTNVAAALLILGEIFVDKERYHEAIQYLKKVETALEQHHCPQHIKSSMLASASELMDECKIRLACSPLSKKPMSEEEIF